MPDRVIQLTICLQSVRININKTCTSAPYTTCTCKLTTAWSIRIWMCTKLNTQMALLYLTGINKFGVAPIIIRDEAIYFQAPGT